TMAMLRIMRIAVHPDCQRRGIGRRLVEAVVAQAGAGDMALTGTSFGVTPDLLGFWQACGWRVVRVGTRRDAASGAHSVLMVRALDGEAEALVNEARGSFSNQFRAQLTDPLRDLDPALVSRLLEQSPECAVPGRTCWEDAVSFAWGRREFGVGLSGLRAVSWWGLASPGVRDNLQPGDAELLVLRVLQGRGWKAVTEATGLPGRAGVIRVLRQAVRTLARAGAPVDLLSDPLFSRGGSN
ncbi:MAG: GNAT family N-acetyltransferase, partial [Aquisalimonadaceae bacterium]